MILKRNACLFTEIDVLGKYRVLNMKRVERVLLSTEINFLGKYRVFYIREDERAWRVFRLCD